MRDAAVDATDSRGGTIAKLMELVVRNAIERRAEVQAFRTKISDEYRKLMDPANLPELGGLATELSTTLKAFYANAAVDLQWQPIDDIQAPPPTAFVQLEEDSFRAPVERTGHGLQRAFILSLLQHLALASSRSAQAQQEDVASGDNVMAEPGASPPAPSLPLLPGLILAIEEPELYQHPTMQRHFAKVLARLTSGQLAGVARTMQVVFATHSPHFVQMDAFTGIKLARRISIEKERPRETVLFESTMPNVCKVLELAHDVSPGTYSALGLLPRLHIMDSGICEGFFASVAVLVEGPSDRAALLASAKLNDVDFEAEGIAIVPCGSVNNIDRPRAIFCELGIPTYIVWDSDLGAEADQVKRNKMLQCLVGISTADLIDAPAFVREDAACFGNKLEKTIGLEIGESLFDKLVDQQRLKFGIEKKRDVLKVPACMEAVLTIAAAEGKRSETLDKIVKAILAKGRAIATAAPA